MSQFRFTHLIIILYLFLYIPKGKAQAEFADFYNNAKANNSELISLHTQRNYLFLENDMIIATNLAPKVYLSSEVLFAPYFNNNGNLISTNPSDHAIGYDVGVTNGGLYAFLFNVEYPVFNHKQVNNLLDQNQLELKRIDSEIKTLELEIEHSLANQYLDALSLQAELQNAQANMSRLAEQLEIIQVLTSHGLYRYIDYMLMEAAIKSDSIDLINAESAYRLNLDELKISCGITDTGFFFLNDYDIDLKQDKPGSSLFLESFQKDSLSAIWQQKVFENQYKPQVKLYANSGLNSTSIPNIGNHFGISAGIQLTYTIFDGKQKNINRQQQLLLIEQVSQQKGLKNNELINQLLAYKKAIESTNNAIKKGKILEKEYDKLLLIYSEELKNAQVSIMDYLNFLQQYNLNKLSLQKNKIELNKLINEYNYWNN